MRRPARFHLLLGTTLALRLTSAGVAQPLPRATPESVGLSSSRLERLTQTLEGDVASGRIPGAVVAIARKGKLVCFKAIGYRDKASGLPMTTDTLFDLASMTKPIVAVGALILVEEGRLSLSDPISRFFPELGKMPVAVLRTDPATGDEEAVMTKDGAGRPVIETVPAARPITIQDLMRHTSGLTYGVSGDTAVHKLYPALGGAAAANMTAGEFIAKLSTLPLLYQPGTVWEYGLSYEVLGLVIENIARRPMGAYLGDEVFQPMGMSDTTFQVSHEKAARYAKPLPTDPLTGKPQAILDLTQPLKFECGGGCAASTAGDYIRFAQMLLNGGALGGRRILSRKAVELMTADHLGPGIRNTLSDGTPAYGGYGFGLGVAVRRQAGMSSVMGSMGDYTWPGSYGTMFWVDPKEQLAVVFMLAARGSLAHSYRESVKTLVYQAITD
jgi:CubicO group peptidase (beta-lactamase class C family)